MSDAKKRRRKAERLSNQRDRAARAARDREEEDAELASWGVFNRRMPNRPARKFDPPPWKRDGTTFLPPKWEGWTDLTLTAEDAAEGVAKNKLFDPLCFCLGRHGFRGVSTSTLTLCVEGFTLLLPDRLSKLVQDLDDKDTSALPFDFRIPVLLPPSEAARNPWAGKHLEEFDELSPLERDELARTLMTDLLKQRAGASGPMFQATRLHMDDLVGKIVSPPGGCSVGMGTAAPEDGGPKFDVAFYASLGGLTPVFPVDGEG